MNRYQKAQGLPSFNTGQFSNNLHNPQKRHFHQNYGQYQVKHMFGKQQALENSTRTRSSQWSGVQNYNQNLSCLWSGKRNFTGSNLNQQFQNQTFNLNSIQNRYPRMNRSNGRYNILNSVGNCNQISHGQRLNSEQLAYDRNEVMKNIYRVKGVSSARHINQQQHFHQHLSRKCAGNINTGSHCKKDFSLMHSYSAQNKANCPEAKMHVDTRMNVWKRNFSQLKGDLNYQKDKEQNTEQDTPETPCVFVTVSCAEQKEGGDSETKQCTLKIPEQIGLKNAECIDEAKPLGLNDPTDDVSTTTKFQDVKRQTIPNDQSNKAEENQEQENNTLGINTCTAKKTLTSQVCQTSVEPTINQTVKCQQNDEKKTTAKDLVNEYFRHSISPDSSVSSLSEQVEIRRNNGNGNHTTPDESDINQSCDKKKMDLSQTRLCRNITKKGENVGRKTKTTKDSDQQSPGNKLPKFIPSEQNKKKKKGESVMPLLPSRQKSDRMDSELFSRMTKTLKDNEKYSDLKLKPNLEKKAVTESNQNHNKPSKMKTDQNRIENTRKGLVNSGKPEINQFKFKQNDTSLKNRPGRTKLEGKEKSAVESNQLLTRSIDSGRIERDGGAKFKDCNKYNDSDVKLYETDKENQTVDSTKYEKKTLIGKVTDQYTVSSDTDRNADIEKEEGNLFDRINQLIDKAIQGKEVVKSNTGGKPERLPFSPNQCVNRQDSLKMVKFNDDVISVDGNGKISRKKIEDSKPYRLAISLFEKKRKMMKSKRKDHSKSRINLKQKLALESKELIKLEKNLSKLKGFKIPKQHKHENDVENLAVLHEVSGKNSLENSADLKSSKLVVQKRNTSTETISSARESKIEKVSVKEGRKKSAKGNIGHVDTLKKGALCKQKKMSDLNGSFEKELKKLENALQTECMTDQSLPDLKEVFDEEVLESPSDLKGKKEGNKNELKGFQNSYQLETKWQNNLTTNCWQRKGHGKNRTTLSENYGKEKNKSQKQQRTKFKRIKIIYDSDEGSPEVPTVVSKSNQKSRLSADDVKRALGAFSYKGEASENTKNLRERSIKHCNENSLFKEIKSEIELDEVKMENKAMKLTFSEISRDDLKGLHSEISGSAIHNGIGGKKVKESKNIEKIKKKNKLNREEGMVLFIDTHTETERSTEVDVQRENGIAKEKRKESNKAENGALEHHKYECDRNIEKKKGKKTFETVNLKGGIDSKLPSLAKEDLANKMTHRTCNAVKNTTILVKDENISEKSNLINALNSKQQNETDKLNTCKFVYQDKVPFTKKEALESRRSSTPVKIVKQSLNVKSETGGLKAKTKVSNSYSKKASEERDVCTRKVNLLEKKSLGYTAPDIQRKSLALMNVSPLNNDKSWSVGRARNDNDEQVKNNKNKHLKSVSDIVAQKLSELKEKADELMCKNVNQDLALKSLHTTNVNHNYCNRSRLDGDRVTSHLFRPDKTKMSESSYSRRDDVFKLKKQTGEKELARHEVVGFPITVINTRTPTVQSVENEEEMTSSEQVKQDTFFPPVQYYKDYSLPEHNKCSYNMKISDRTALYAANLPDLESFSRDKQQRTSEVPPQSNGALMKSVYGEKAGTLRNDPLNVTALQQPRKLNLSWEDIFPVPNYYFRMKNVLADLNINEEETQAIVNVTDTASKTGSLNQNVSDAGDRSGAASYKHSRVMADVGQTYTPMSHSSQQTYLTDSSCQLAEGPYIAYPLGKVSSDLNEHVGNVQYPEQPVPHGSQRGDNFMQMVPVHYNSPNQAGILTNYNGPSQTHNYQQGSYPCQSTQDVVDYNHGMPSSCDNRLLHVSREDQSIRNSSFISPFSSRPQKEEFLDKNALSSNYGQMPCDQQSTGWNPKIPLMDVSFDENHANATSVYMQSVIVQHKTINRFNCENYSRKSNAREGREGTWPVQRCQNETHLDRHPAFCGNPVFPANVVVSENSSLARDTGINKEHQFEVPENVRKPVQDINNKLNDKYETESRNSPILLVDSRKVSGSKMQSSVSRNETTKSPQTVIRNPYSECSKNENEQLQVSDTQENQTNGCSSILLNEGEAPKLSNGSALSSHEIGKEIILDESTGQFKSVKIAHGIFHSPETKAESVFKVLETPENQPASSNSTLGTCFTSNATLSNCKVDPKVKGRMKYPLVMLSPLKMTKELEDMIDDCIAKNSSMFDSSSLPIFHSPLWSIETPSISPRNTPILALSSLSPPVLSPCGLPKLSDGILNEKQDSGISKQTISTKKQMKKKRETRSKVLKSILPSRQYDREKTLFETAEMFLGEDFPNKSTRKRKRTENVKKNKKAKPGREKQSSEHEDIPCEIFKKLEKFEEPSKHFESSLKGKDIDNKGTIKSHKVNPVKDNFSIDNDQRQLNAQNFKECEVNDIVKKTKISPEMKTEEELPLLQRLLEKTLQQTKNPTVLEEKDTVIEETKDKSEDTTGGKEGNLHFDVVKDSKESLLTKKIKMKSGSCKKSLKSNKYGISDTVSDMGKVCDLRKENVLDGKSSAIQENNVKYFKESKLPNQVAKLESGISERADTQFESENGDKIANKELASDLEQTSTKSSENNHDRSIVIAKKDGQWILSTSKKKRGKSKNTNRLQKDKEISQKTSADLEKVQCTEDEAEMKGTESVDKGNQVDNLPKIHGTEITNNNYIEHCDSIEDSGGHGNDKKEEQEFKKKGTKRKKQKLMENDCKANQLESENMNISTDKTDHETQSKSQWCQNSKVNTVVDTETDKLEGKIDEENTTTVNVLCKRPRTCKVKRKSSTAENNVSVKKKQATVKNLKVSKEDEKGHCMEIETGKSNSDNLQMHKNIGTADKKNKLAGESSNMQNNLPIFSPKISIHSKKSKKKNCRKDSRGALEKTSLDSTSSADHMKKDANKIIENKTSTTSTKKKALKRKKMVSDHLKKFSGKAVPVKKRAMLEGKKFGEKVDGEPECGICDERFTSKDLLNAHTLIRHPYRCFWCKVDFDSKEASKEHYFSHMKATYECYTCNMKYGNPSTYKLHLKSRRHRGMLEKSKEVQTGGQPSTVENSAPGSSVSDQIGKNPSLLGNDGNENFVVQIENVEKPVDQWLPADTVAQFYSSLQQTSQMSWCDFSISNNNVELHYNQTGYNTQSCENGPFPWIDISSDLANQNSTVPNQDGHQNTSINNYLSDVTQVVPEQQFGLPATNENIMGFDPRLFDPQSANESVMDNSSVFVENGKVYTKLTDVKPPEGLSQPVSCNSGYTEMSDEDVVDTEQHLETSTLCRIANSFSLSPFIDK